MDAATPEGRRFDLVVSGGRVFDGTSWLGSPCHIGIVGNRIAAVSATPLSAERIVNAAGRYVPAGLDRHAHPPFRFHDRDRRRNDGAVRRQRASGSAAIVARLRRHDGQIRRRPDCGEHPHTRQDRHRRARRATPLTTGLGITAPDGHPAATVYRLNPWYRARATGEVDTIEDARRLVSHLAETGVDAIKLLSQGACACAESERYIWRSKISGAEVPIVRIRSRVLDAAIDQAHRHGLKVTVHTYDQGPAIAALEAGADGLEHGVVGERIADPRLIDLLIKSGASYVPTLWIYNFEQNTRNLKDVADAGGRVALGTDSFSGYGSFGPNTLVEAERMNNAGLSPIQVLRAATSDAAEHLGNTEIGTIAAGKLADLIVLDSDPMENISNLRTLRTALANGRVVFERAA